MADADLVQRILARWPIGVLSTFGRDGISSVPIVFTVYQGVIFSPIDNKPKSSRRLARVKNLERDNRYTLLLQHYDENWSNLWWLRVTGVGASVADEAVVSRTHVALAGKYPQYRDGRLLEGASEILRLEIGETRAWAYRGEDWLAHRFSESNGGESA